MNLHRLAEERSVAYHQRIAEYLLADSQVLETARKRVEGWLAASSRPPFYARKWSEVLAGPTTSIAAFLVDRSELATELRQSSPFAGALRPRERWRIFREARERLADREILLRRLKSVNVDLAMKKAAQAAIVRVFS